MGISRFGCRRFLDRRRASLHHEIVSEIVLVPSLDQPDQIKGVKKGLPQGALVHDAIAFELGDAVVGQIDLP